MQFHRRAGGVSPLILVLFGCHPSSIQLPEPVADSPTVELASRFNPAQCGTLTGRVEWTGTKPDIAAIRRPLSNVQFESIENPNALRLNETNGVVGAVVVLTGVDPAKSKPWPHEPVTVQLNERGIFINGGRVGIVRLGERVVFQAGGEKPLGVRGRGADFFGHILSPKQNSTSRVLSREGRVELSSASGQFWASADLIVSAHPYVALTDADGRFCFEQVPPGTYTITVDHPNWVVAASEIDPESSVTVRQRYAAPLEKQATVQITSSQTAEASITLSSAP